MESIKSVYCALFGKIRQINYLLIMTNFSPEKQPSSKSNRQNSDLIGLVELPLQVPIGMLEHYPLQH